jgi:transcriptional regulator with XRE-family HTH domain
MRVHEKLRTLRSCRNWTQEEIAEKLGWAVNTYAKIERGEADVKLEKLKQIADVMGVDVTELLNGDDKTIINVAEHCPYANLTQGSLSNCTILLSESQCAHQLDKLTLILDHKEREIGWLKEENLRLKEIIALLQKGD